MGEERAVKMPTDCVPGGVSCLNPELNRDLKRLEAKI
ncbi:hypothetical protein SAMN04488688_101613 [Paenibacillus sp. cl141a]|nr:hypothetical protein SAMN04488688_101613 [Paenibacillus sp. cl141a]